MTPRKPLVAANWKMHSPPQGWDGDDAPYGVRDDVDVIVFPSYLDIRTCLEKFLTVGAQHGRPETTGAFTGDVSMQLLAEHGCKYVLCGHSERRIHHHEDDAFIAKQVHSALERGMTPILCIGETLEEREAEREKEVIQAQLQAFAEGALIAYEPVWAIGTGNSAEAPEAEEMHAFIRSLLPEHAAKTVRIIYGGSVKPESAASLIAQKNIDGFLVGGASLDLKSFAAILETVVE